MMLMVNNAMTLIGPMDYYYTYYVQIPGIRGRGRSIIGGGTHSYIRVVHH